MQVKPLLEDLDAVIRGAAASAQVNAVPFPSIQRAPWTIRSCLASLRTSSSGTGAVLSRLSVGILRQRLRSQFLAFSADVRGSAVSPRHRVAGTSARSCMVADSSSCSMPPAPATAPQGGDRIITCALGVLVTAETPHIT